MPTYNSKVFDCTTIQQAKAIILTPENGISVDDRWVSETNWLLPLLLKHFTKRPGLVLDFGCGIGRISKELSANGLTCVGVDASSSMRKFAAQDVPSPAFSAISPQVLTALTQNGAQFDYAISIWVLQHCLDLEVDAGKIIQALKPGGKLFVLDMKFRALPTDIGWCNDGKDVAGFLKSQLNLIAEYPYNPPHAPTNLLTSAWIGVFEK